MSDEATPDQDEQLEDESTPERKSHGPGFRLGLLLGGIAGAVVAALAAPSTGEELRRNIAGDTGLGADADASAERVRSVLEVVRARVQEAADQAREAAELAEQQGRARYAELTGSEPDTTTDR